MNRALLIGAGALGGAALWMYLESQGASEYVTTDETEPTFLDEAMSQATNLILSPVDLVLDPQVRAFLWLVRTGEGTTGQDGYRTIFGGSKFTGWADHPRKLIVSGPYRSTAAGAYQFLSTTWDEMREKYDLVDFSPSCQDIAAVGLIKRRGALADVLAGRFRTAIDKCNKEWASLPGSPYGQPTMTYTKAQNVLVQSGANILGSVA